jgi:hypothetical protein
VAKAIALPLQDVSSAPLTFDAGQQRNDREPLAPQDAWVAKLDYEAFGKEVAVLGRSLLQEGGEDDVSHLNKMVSWRNLCAVIGCATVWMAPNPLTILALSTWTYSSWTMIGTDLFCWVLLPSHLDGGSSPFMPHES